MVYQLAVFPIRLKVSGNFHKNGHSRNDVPQGITSIFQYTTNDSYSVNISVMGLLQF